MNDDLQNIEKLIIKIHNLGKMESRMRHSNEYKCNNYNDYKTDYYKIKMRLNSTRSEFIERCNDCVGYPTNKFLCFDLSKKIKFKNEKFIGLLLEIPFIDKQEYFCLINLFEHMKDYMYEWNKSKYLFKTW